MAKPGKEALQKKRSLYRIKRERQDLMGNKSNRLGAEKKERGRYLHFYREPKRRRDSRMSGAEICIEVGGRIKG